ncbi:response regulator [Thalassotalea euphylliae]|uniref:Response regulator n=1 Tax=Thalassotalea euphylliae TaxID=1655234 RepID=A0A3E0TIQ8_9GAMM|nr:response regulator [Thalassotalea euphylliae]REL24421.1 response regulator [Thalassotalea euphylliae]
MKHVLIIDDSRLAREAIAKILIGCNFDRSAIAFVENGQDALELMTMQPVDLLIIGDNLADFTPVRLLEEIQVLENAQNTIHSEQTSQSVRTTKAPHLVLYREPATKISLEQRPDLDATTLAKPFDRHNLCTTLHQLTNSACFEHHQQQDIRLTSEEKAETGGSVLIVDDESSNIEVAAGILKNRYRVIAAKNGKQALTILAKQRGKIDLVLLDIMMPEMDGYQVCSAIKNDSETAHIPVIFLTAKSQVEDITKGFAAGAVDYITKPLQGEILLARVNTHTTLKHNQEKLARQVNQLEETAQLREDIEKITQHDLKAPLASILFHAGKITDKPLASAIKSTVNNVIGMINLSLELYKIEQGIYQFSPVATSIEPLIQDAISGCQLEAENKQIKLVFNNHSKCQASIEPLLCLSVFSNLIKNAVEAAPVGSEISIELTDDNDTLVFSCKNLGVIPEPLRNNLFDKYVSGNIKQGSGLGAYSAKLMTEAQGGQIQYEIEQELYTRFIVTLPAQGQ